MIKPATHPPAMFSIAQVAKAVNLSTRTIRRCIERGELRIYRLGGQIRISQDDLSAYLAKNRQ